MVLKKRFNRRKATVLALINRLGSITPKKLMLTQGISSGYARKVLSVLHKWGYLKKPAYGRYSLTDKGQNIREKFANRLEIERTIGEEVSLNFKHYIGRDITQHYFEVTGHQAPINI